MYSCIISIYKTIVFMGAWVLDKLLWRVLGADCFLHRHSQWCRLFHLWFLSGDSFVLPASAEIILRDLL